MNGFSMRVLVRLLWWPHAIVVDVRRLPMALGMMWAHEPLAT